MIFRVERTPHLARVIDAISLGAADVTKTSPVTSSESTLPLESRRTKRAEAGETKNNPRLRAINEIKLCILELPVIFIIFSPVKVSIQRCAPPDLLKHAGSAPFCAIPPLHLPLQQFSLKSVRQKVYEPPGLSSRDKVLQF